MNEVEIDINNALNMYNNINECCTFQKYDKIYAFTNEYQKKYMPYFDCNGNVLTVAASGDHMLNAILGGAESITLFDINKLSKYYCNLKLAALKECTLEEFIAYFKAHDCIFGPSLDCNIYKKIQRSLDDESLYFWNTMYEKMDFNNNNIRREIFLSSGDFSYSDYIESENYYLMKKRVNTVKFDTFLNVDVFELSSLVSKEYKSIFLSNISDYIMPSHRNKYKKLLKNLRNNLVLGGKIQYGYNFVDYDSRMEFFGEGFSKQELDGASVLIYTKKQ